MTRAEAGKLGYLASIEIHALRYQRGIEKYLQSPNICNFCKKNLVYEKRRQRFCDQHCAAYKNGELRRVYHFCGLCKCVLSKRQGIQDFCSGKCHRAFVRNTYIERWKAGLEIGGTLSSVSEHVRRWLKEQFNGCYICKNVQWCGKDIPLIADHINGDSSNHRPENLRLVCGNCDMQLPTYKNKNKGRGRAYRRKIAEMV